MDLADPAVRRAFLRADHELRTTIRTYYGARSAMLMLFVGILFGVAVALVLLREASGLAGWSRWTIAAGAALATAMIPIATMFIGASVVHRFSKSCRKKPLQPGDIRVRRRPA